MIKHKYFANKNKIHYSVAQMSATKYHNQKHIPIIKKTHTAGDEKGSGALWVRGDGGLELQEGPRPVLQRSGRRRAGHQLCG